MGQEKLARVRVDRGAETQAVACAGGGVGPPNPARAAERGP